MECEDKDCREFATDEDYGRYGGTLCPWHVSEAFQMDAADLAIKVAKESR